MTTPAAAAAIGDPYAAPRSMPSCMRPQRQPNGLVIGALTGQMNPAPETCWTVECACAARIFAARSALAAWRPSISSASARSWAFSESRLTFFCSRAASRLALVRDQLVAQHPHLVHAHGDDLRLAPDSPPEEPRLPPRDRDLVLRGVHLGDDLPVAAHDQTDVVEPVDQVGEAVRGEQEGQLVRRVRLVAGHEPPVQAVERDPVLLLEELEALGLELEERVQPVQLQLP